MRHLYDKVHLNRTRSHRMAMLGNMSAALFTHKRIQTTLVKARYARRFAERMITFARKGDVAARRHVLRYIRNGEAVKKLFDELGPHFKNRDGGYTRIIKLGTRRGDAAPMALLELVGFDDATTPEKSTKKTAKSRLKTAQKTDKDSKAKTKPAKEKAEEAVETVEAAEPKDVETNDTRVETAEEVAEVKADEKSPETEAPVAEAAGEEKEAAESTDVKNEDSGSEESTDATKPDTAEDK